MANNNDDVVKKVSRKMNDLGDFTDDELGEITHLLVMVEKVVPPEGGPIRDNKPLSSRVGLCINMKELILFNCSVIPSEISYCTLLSRLRLFSEGNAPLYDGGDCRIELPEEIILPNLTSFGVHGGSNWNTDEIISWLTTYSPNLTTFCVSGLPKDTANQFMRLLQNNEAFIEKLKHKLLGISFYDCNLNEDDARVILFNIKPSYPRLYSIDLQNNNIEGLETIGMAVRETRTANNNLLPSNLRYLFLKGNPCYDNLNNSESPDSVAMLCLLKNFQLLKRIDSHNNNTIIYSPIIDYWLMMNASELRYLLDDGHGGTWLSILPYIMHRVYNQREQDPTKIFTLLREGPIFRTNYRDNDNDNRSCCCMVFFTSYFFGLGITK